MARVNVFGEFETTSYSLAALLSCDGYALVRCKTGNETSWAFRDIPSCDLDIYLEEVSKEETTVPLKRFLRGLKTIQQAEVESRRCLGHWSSYKGRYATETAA